MAQWESNIKMSSYSFEPLSNIFNIISSYLKTFYQKKDLKQPNHSIVFFVNIILFLKICLSFVYIGTSSKII